MASALVITTALTSVLRHQYTSELDFIPNTRQHHVKLGSKPSLPIKLVNTTSQIYENKHWHGILFGETYQFSGET